MEIRVPEVGESIFTALVAKWLKPDGADVAAGETLCELETDKITIEIAAEAAGILRIKVAEGTTVKIGSVIGLVDTVGTDAPGAARDRPQEGTPHLVSPARRKQTREQGSSAVLPGERKEAPKIVTAAAVTVPAGTPLVRSEETEPYRVTTPAGERESRVSMSPIRRRIAERLLAARQQTAMLTTFNEVEMSRIIALRDRHKAGFQERHGVSLGFMPFFVKACCEALGEFPAVNARIDGNDIVYQHFFDIGIAISGEKGLVVPVLRQADRLRFAEIESAIADFVVRIRDNRLVVADLEGGSFTISNGGVFGSLLSTPIINPPQSGVLGMHAIQERPVARDGAVVIRPMMYLALSYDHRIIDGREAVGFLRKVKEYVENPEEMLLEG